MSAYVGFDRDDFEMVENERLAKRPTEQEIRENIKSLGEARKMRDMRKVRSAN
jgi:predicted AAA+ superfamily ATPase